MSSVKFLADENYAFSSFKLLLKTGIDIKHISEIRSGIEDAEVLEIAIKEDRVILTFDSDFGELVFKKGMRPIGVVYYRLSSYSPKQPAEILLKLMNKEDMKFTGYFTVIAEDQIRQRTY